MEMVIRDIEGRMMMHILRYGTVNADSTMKHFAEVLTAVLKYQELDLASNADDESSLAQTFAEIAVHLQNCIDENEEGIWSRSEHQKLKDILSQLDISGESMQELYKELVGIAGIEPVLGSEEFEMYGDTEYNLERDEDEIPDYLQRDYEELLPVIGMKKYRESRDDVFAELKKYSFVNIGKEFNSEEKRRALYLGLREVFAKHMDEDIAEIASLKLFRSLLYNLTIDNYKETEKLKDQYTYTSALWMIGVNRFRTGNIIDDSEKKYAELLRNLGYNGNPIQINRAAEHIAETAEKLQSLASPWTIAAHCVLYDDIDNELVKLEEMNYLSYSMDKNRTDEVYRAVCKEMNLAPIF